MTHSHSAAAVSLRSGADRPGRSSSSPSVPAALPHVQIYDDSRAMGLTRGARCRHKPARAQGCLHVQAVGEVTDFPGFFFRDDLPVTRGGLRARPAFHQFDFRTQPTWQGIADVLPSHFLSLRHSVSAGIKPSQGVVGNVRNYEGEARSV